MRTAICDIFSIKYPILQGGMACLGTWELASAVSNAGGLGIIGAGNAPADWVWEQIQRTRERTSRPFAVNVMLMSPYVEEVTEVVLAQGVPIVALGGSNLPLAYVSRFKEAGLKVMPVVSTVALAKRVERLGADVIVAEGMESGGHIGEATTMVLVPQVIDAVSVPVVAAGGFCDGRGLVAALALGAQGVQLGTRFICSEECIAHTEFKERILRSGDMATAVTGKALGHPVRALRNKLTREFLAKERAGVSKEELEQLGMGKLHLGVIEGDVDNGSLMAGQVVGLVKEIKPVAEIIEGIITEAEAIIDRLSGIPYREKSWTRSL